MQKCSFRAIILHSWSRLELTWIKKRESDLKPDCKQRRSSSARGVPVIAHLVVRLFSAYRLVPTFPNFEPMSMTPCRVRQDKLAEDRRCKSFTG